MEIWQGKCVWLKILHKMEQEVLGIRDPAVKQDTPSPSSHRTYTCRESEVREADSKHVDSEMNEIVFQTVTHAMQKSEEGYRWRRLVREEAGQQRYLLSGQLDDSRAS